MNFKCSIENDKKTVILKEVDPLVTMKQFELIITEKMELKSPFQILTGYPPAILLYEATDPVNTKLKGNDLLIISTPTTDHDIPPKNSLKHNTKTKKSLLKKETTKAKPSKSNISYFSDKISNDSSQIGKERESKGDEDEDFELDQSDDGVIGISRCLLIYFSINFLVENSRSKRNRPPVQYQTLDQQEEPKSKRKASLKRKNNDNKILPSNKAPKKLQVHLDNFLII